MPYMHRFEEYSACVYTDSPPYQQSWPQQSWPGLVHLANHATTSTNIIMCRLAVLAEKFFTYNKKILTLHITCTKLTHQQNSREIHTLCTCFQQTEAVCMYDRSYDIQYCMVYTYINVLFYFSPGLPVQSGYSPS